MRSEASIPPTSIAEDVDLCLRPGAAGYRIALCTDAWISHPAEDSLPVTLRRAYRQGWSMVQHHHRLPGPIGGRLHLHPGAARAHRLGAAPVRHRARTA